MTVRLHRAGVRVGADLLGLATNHNLGIGQFRESPFTSA